MPEISTTFRVEGADEIVRVLRGMESQARQFGATVQTTFQPAQQAVRAFTGALGSLSTILRLTGAANADLARQIETASVAVLSITLAVQGLRGATAGYTAALVVLRTTMASVAVAATAMWAALLGPFGAVLAAAVAVGAGLAFLGEKTGFARREVDDLSQEMDESASRAASWVRAWSSQSTAFELVRESAFDLRLELRGLLGVQDELTAQWRVGTAKVADQRAEAAKREAEAGAKLARQLAELRIQRESEATVSNTVAERNFHIAESLRRQADFLRQVTEAEAIRTAGLEKMAQALGLFQTFKTPFEEGLIPAVQGLTENLEEIAEAARQAQRVLGVEWPEALTVAREALKLAKEEGIGLAEALQRIKFNREFLRELELVNTGMKKWFDTWEKFKFGAEDIAINEPQRWASGWSGAIEGIQQLLPALQSAFGNLFEDVLTNAKDFGESILGFFRSIVNAVISLFAQHVATRIFKFLFPVFGLASGGIVTGGLTPIASAQLGMIVDRPTLAMVGEGGEREMVLPERFWPALRQGGGQRDRRPQEIVIHNYVVFDRSQIPSVTPEEIQTAVLADIRKGGPIGQTIRRTVR